MDVLYWKKPTASELAGTAYRVEDYPEPHVEVWDENWDALSLFMTYSTQWRIGMNGPVGLDYNVFHHAMDRKGIVGDEFDKLIQDLGTIEQAALLKIHDDN